MHFNFPIFNHFLSGGYMLWGYLSGGICLGVFVQGVLVLIPFNCVKIGCMHLCVFRHTYYLYAL